MGEAFFVFAFLQQHEWLSYAGATTLEALMKRIVLTALYSATLAACTFPLQQRAATSSAPVEGASAPSHDQQCSQLRADIASAQHNQRTVAPGTSTPIIAAASEGKEDQKIHALQERFTQLGCVGNPARASSSPTH